MAKLGVRLRAGSARRAAGLRGPGPLLLVGLALLGAARALESADGGFSLHPPYFNLAEGARIAASATCGEEAPARGAPRPTEDLYCKLVGGPVAGGDPNQTIQVSAGRGWVAAGRAGWRGRRRGTRAPERTWRGALRYGPKPARAVPTPRFRISGNGKDPSSAFQARPEKCASPGGGGRAGRGLVPSPWRPRVLGSRRGRDLASTAAARGEGADPLYLPLGQAGTCQCGWDWDARGRVGVPRVWGQTLEALTAHSRGLKSFPLGI